MKVHIHFIIICLILLAIPAISAREDIFNITQSGTRISYQIDYGCNLTNASLISYRLNTTSTLLAVQDWIIYGSNDGTGWSIINTSENIAFTADTEQTFDIISPSVFRYYQFYITDGFYTLGDTLTITFNTTIGVDTLSCVAGGTGSPGIVYIYDEGGAGGGYPELSIPPVISIMAVCVAGFMITGRKR